MTGRKKPELLAPAGGPLALRAAVENGADAVYLGGKLFGARAYAENFTREELVEALDYAHIRGVKVYVTVNTLVDNREFGELADYLFFLSEKGADAILVQDLGVAAFARKLLPELPLHASTQMTVHNAAGVKFLEEFGFTRVVLARETSLEDIKEIRRKTQLELEVFVHGALCFCYSGQCLFSSLIGGRSGNRGRCAQPCRLPYQLVDENGRDLSARCLGSHLLSPKDLMLIEELPLLLEAGVSALKIEGRMKRPEYVATVVRIYREALDRAYADPKNYQVNDEELRELAQIFNRGFTTGYFFGNPGRDLIGYTRPNNRGIYLGRVLQVKRGGKVVFRPKLPLQGGDGIEFWTRGGDRKGFTVHTVSVQGSQQDHVEPGAEVEINVPFEVRPGDRIFKTHDDELIRKAQRSFSGPPRKKLAIAVKVSASVGQPLKMEAWDFEGNHVEVEGELLGECALKHPLTPEVLRRQIERLGNTPFALKELKVSLDEKVIFPLSEINRVRRSLIAALEEARANRYKRYISKQREKEVMFWRELREQARRVGKESSWPLLAVAVGDWESARAAITGGANILYFGGVSLARKKAWNPDSLAEVVGLCRSKGVNAYLILPRIWQEKDRGFTEEMLWRASELGVDGVLVGDLGGLHLALDSGLEVVTDFSLPAFNDPAVSLLFDLGVSRVTLSPELNREQLQNLSFRETGKLELLVHGVVPVMISEHCVLGAVTGENPCRRACEKLTVYLKDRKGYLFPLVFDQHCRMTIYNARELCLVEYFKEIVEGGYGALRLELRWHQPRQVKQITSIYRRALEAVNSGLWSQFMGERLWTTLSQVSPLGLTRGHYLRGVLGNDEGGVQERADG